MKRALGFAGIVFGVLLLAVVAARWYLQSRWAADHVTSMLKNVYGGSVRVTDVDIGVTGDSSVHGVDLLESGDDAPAIPWLSIDKLQTDVGILALLRGSAVPKNI